MLQKKLLKLRAYHSQYNLPHFTDMEMRLGFVKQLAQGHTAGKECSKNTKLVLQMFFSLNLSVKFLQ